MRFTQYTDYALRVLIFLAGRNGTLSTIGEIAAAYRISENHLTKVVHGLAKLGYVSTLRGRGGGILLARSPAAINIGEVVRRTEETLALVECLADGYGGACTLDPRCRLKSALAEAQRACFAQLDRYTLADVSSHASRFPLALSSASP